MNKDCLLKNIFSVVIFALLSGNATATMITYTYASTGSGDIGSVSFSNADFVITAIADTADRTAFSNGFSIVHDSASINITGVGNFSFLTSTSGFVNNTSSVVGFSALALDRIDVTSVPLFSTWGLITSIGSIEAAGNLRSWGTRRIGTTGGELVFNSDASATVTFQASLVPVPAAVWLFGSGLIGLIGISRQNKRAEP